MKCMRQTAEPTWIDYETNRGIAKELNLTAVLDKIQRYRRKWLQRTHRSSRIRLTTVLKTTDQQVEETRRDH